MKNTDKIKEWFAGIGSKRIGIYLILILFAIVALLPIWVGLVTSLKPEPLVPKTNPLLPANPTIGAYSEALHELGRPIINSLTFVTGAVLISTFLGSVLGYIFSKIRFKHDNIVFMLVVIGIFLPYTTIVFPLYKTFSELAAVATLPGMVLVHTVYGIPICSFLFRNFYVRISQDKIDKAREQGAGDWDIYRNIILPASGPAVVAVVLYQFTSVWNDFLFGLILGGGKSQAMPISVGLQGLFSGTLQWNVLMAGAMIYILPVALLYVFLTKYFVWAETGEAEELSTD